MKNLLLFMLWVVFPLIGETPVAVYLTWEKSPETTMTVLWLTSTKDLQDQITYREKDKTEWNGVVGSHTLLPYVYPNYFVHCARLSQLKPNQEYVFRIGEEKDERLFRTLPSTLLRPIRFIVGGDVYHSTIDRVNKMDKVVADQDPDFVLVGGDIAYAMEKTTILPEAIRSRLFSRKLRHRWIDLLQAFSKDFITKEGRMIPLVAIAGNHDVNGSFGQTPKAAPQYITLFPFPGEKGFQALDFGDYMSVIFLDSGQMYKIQGEQTDWLEETLQERKQLPFKFAIYHVPAYPSFRSFNSEPSRTVRLNWIPIFERYGLTAAFENHDHTYKRTHRLLRGMKDPKGVLYVGDGAWGVKHPRIPATPQERPYLAFSSAKRHVIVVTIGKDMCEIKAIDEEGKVFDVAPR